MKTNTTGNPNSDPSSGSHAPLSQSSPLLRFCFPLAACSPAVRTNPVFPFTPRVCCGCVPPPEAEGAPGAEPPAKATLNCSRQEGGDHCFLTCQSQVHISGGGKRHQLRGSASRHVPPVCFAASVFCAGAFCCPLVFVTRQCVFAGNEDSYTVTCGMPLLCSTGRQKNESGSHCLGKYTIFQIGIVSYLPTQTKSPR